MELGRSKMEPRGSFGARGSKHGAEMFQKEHRRNTGNTNQRHITQKDAPCTPKWPVDEKVAKGSQQAPPKYHKDELFRTKELSSAPIKIRALYNEHSTILSAGPGELVASLVRIFVLKNDASEYTKNVFGATKKCRAPLIKKK